MRTTEPPLLRFMRKVAPGDGGCWIWFGAIAGTNSSYGYFNPGGDETIILAHRWIYQQLIGPIPEGHELDHLCREILCVNPSHLEPVTPAENQRRRRLETCRSGLHDLTNPDNVNWDRLGRRRGCKLCNGRKPNVRV